MQPTNHQTFKHLTCTGMLLFVVLSSLALVYGEPTTTIINNGPAASRVDIAILGDGYTASEMTKFQNDVQTFVQAMFAQDPYREYQRYFNVRRVDVISNQSGADHPERGAFVDTAFDATYDCSGTQRLICVNTTKVLSALQRSLSPAEYDMKLIIVNDSEYGGSGGTVAVASTNAQAVEIILHELGHSFGLLLDEYGGSTCSQFSEPGAPNITAVSSRNQIKWNYWIDANTPVPTTSPSLGVPGLFQGGWFCDNGYNRPTYDSKMRTLGRPFDQINTEQLVKRIYNVVSPMESGSPASTSITLNQSDSQLFLVNSPAPLTHTLDVTWFIDGQFHSTGQTFFVTGTELSPGSHSIDVLVKDNTSWVRSDMEQLLSDSKHWTITLTGNSAPPPNPGPTPTSAPVLITEDNLQRAVALDSVTMLRDPFSATTNNNFSADHRTRIILYAQNIDWTSMQNVSALTAQVDFGPTVLPAVVEFIGFVSDINGYARVVVRLPDGLPLTGDVGVRIAINGVFSNRVLIGLKP
ncbi:MAG: hypothetical protein C5B55_04975 [Blastocatellia bacterium]|nr:MAG: hypothetical protein C5B55_04975 [Blastocatellia bacterium]